MVGLPALTYALFVPGLCAQLWRTVKSRQHDESTTTMHESGWHDSDSGDEDGSYTTLRPIYADEAADYINRMFGHMAGSQRPTPCSIDPPSSPKTAEPTSILDDLKDMGWFDG